MTTNAVRRFILAIVVAAPVLISAQQAARPPALAASGDMIDRIVHGSGDDNVHYQGSQLLVNRLIELGKPFDFMTYPDRTHAISEGPGTAPHLYHLLTRFLTTHLAAGGREPSSSRN